MKVVPVLALALLLCACNSGAATPTGSPSPTTTSASPSPARSEDPKAALERAVREYYDEANRALATGNVTRLVSLSTDNCSCRGLVKYVQDKYKIGSIRGGAFTVRSVRPYDVQPARAVVQVVQDAAAFEVLDRSGKTVERGDAEPNNTDDFYFVLRGDRWIVDNVVGVK